MEDESFGDDSSRSGTDGEYKYNYSESTEEESESASFWSDASDPDEEDGDEECLRCFGPLSEGDVLVCVFCVGIANEKRMEKTVKKFKSQKEMEKKKM